MRGHMADDATDTSTGSASRDGSDEGGDGAAGGGTRLDEPAVDVLAWLLDTETRARIYVYLRQHPWSTSEEVAEGTGLYPSTVREALAALTDDETLYRRKRQSEGAGNNPFEYTAIPPSELVGGVVGQVQSELNTVFNLDKLLDREEDDETFDQTTTSEPVTITVENVEDEEPTDAADASSNDGDTTSTE